MTPMLPGVRHARLGVGLRLVRSTSARHLSSGRAPSALASNPQPFHVNPVHLQNSSGIRRTAMSTTSVANDAPATVGLDLVGRDGSNTRIHIHPSYAHKPQAVQNLLKSLPALLTDAGMPSGAIRRFATHGWDLDEGGDTIHRYVEVSDQMSCDRILDQIQIASRELNHDPHIHIDGSQMTISCTTHVPPGLSMKDVKLAGRINDILAEAKLTSTTVNSDEADILTQRQRAREHNMEAVRKAKLSCSCS